MRMFYLSDNGISVREFCLGDIDNKVKWINNPQNNQYLHYDIPICRAKTIDWFKNKSENRLDCVIEYYNVPVGLVGLIGLDEKNKKAEFYISMGEHKFKRKGIAYLATKLILRYAFDEIDIRKVYLNVDEENLPACKLYEKVGFKCEGRFIKECFHRGKFINRLRYAIFAENFKY